MATGPATARGHASVAHWFHSTRHAILSKSCWCFLLGMATLGRPVCVWAEQMPTAADLRLHVASPDWRDQITYFLMIDRFEDGDSSNNRQGPDEYHPADGARTTAAAISPASAVTSTTSRGSGQPPSGSPRRLHTNGGTRRSATAAITATGPKTSKKSTPTSARSKTIDGYPTASIAPGCT